jgi:hypothetical protein
VAFHDEMPPAGRPQGNPMLPVQGPTPYGPVLNRQGRQLHGLAGFYGRPIRKLLKPPADFFSKVQELDLGKMVDLTVVHDRVTMNIPLIK